MSNTQVGRSLSLTILFPPPFRSALSKQASRAAVGRYQPGDIPDGSYAVKIVLTNPTTGANVVPPRIVTAPLSPVTGSLATPVTINFPNLPVGPIQVDVTAHGLPDTSDPPLGIGSGTGTILPLGTTVVKIPLKLTAFELKTASTLHMSPQSPGRLNAQILDKNGSLLRTPLKFFSLDTNIATVPATGMSGVTIQVTALSQSGSVQIEVLEPDSSLQTFVTFLIP